MTEDTAKPTDGKDGAQDNKSIVLAELTFAVIARAKKEVEDQSGLGGLIRTAFWDGASTVAHDMYEVIVNDASPKEVVDRMAKDIDRMAEEFDTPREEGK